MFDYYAEIFYYYFFSTRDIIAQLINLYYRINIPEYELRYNKKIFDKINNVSVKDSAIIFHENAKSSSDIRNGFAHRFPLNKPNYRSEITEIDGKKILGKGGGDFIGSEKIKENMDFSLNSLSMLMEELKEHAKLKIK